MPAEAPVSNKAELERQIESFTFRLQRGAFVRAGPVGGLEWNGGRRAFDGLS